MTRSKLLVFKGRKGEDACKCVTSSCAQCGLCIKVMCFDAERCENRQKETEREMCWCGGSLSEGHVMQGSTGPPLPLLKPYCRVSTADRANANEGHAESQWLNREWGSRDKLAPCPLPHKTKRLSIVNLIILRSELTLSIKGVIWSNFKFSFIFGVLQADCA